MSRQTFNEFRRFWLKNYIEQFKNGKRKTRREIKKNIYKNINLTEEEKDRLWEEIVRWGYENSECDLGGSDDN